MARVFIFCSFFFLFASSLRATPRVPPVRIHLGDFDRVVLTLPNGGEVHDSLHSGPFREVRKGGELTLVVKEGQVGLDTRKKPVFYFKDRKGEVRFQNELYDGIFKVYVTKNRLRVINVANIENYLLGVVGYEMAPDWPLEALKAQAVLARTYAMKVYHGQPNHKDEDFDVCNTTHCQVYRGRIDRGGVREAVRQTLGLVLVDKQNRLISSFYSGSCGGKTATNAQAWNGPLLPYLVCQEDPYCVKSDATFWRRSYPFQEIVGKLKNNYPGIDRTRKIRVRYGPESGRVESVTFVLPDRSYDIEGGKLRVLMNVKEFPSNIFKVQIDQEVAESRAREPDLFLLGGDGPGLEPSLPRKFLGREVYILDATRRGAGGEYRNLTLKASGDYLREAIKKQSGRADTFTDTLVFLGRGFGHGVGMCQRGAQVQAQQGRTFRDIIAFYFRDVQLKCLYPGRSIPIQP